MDAPLEWLLSFLRDERGNLSSAALRAIPERVAPENLRPLLSHQDEVVRYLALEMLGNRATLDDLEPLLSDDYSISRTAENLLLESANAQQLLPLIENYDGYDEEKIIKTLATRATLNELRDFLHAQVSQVRRFALEAIGERATRQDVEQLLQNEGEEDHYAAFERFVKWISLEELRPFLTSDDPYLRRYAMQAYLPFAANSEVIDLLRENDGDTFADIAKNAAESGLLQDLESIWRDVAHTPIWKRHRAFEIYAAHASSMELKAALLTVDPVLRPDCFYSARHLADVAEFIPFLHSGSEEECCKILHLFGDKMDANQIRPLLHDEEIRIRLSALRALGERATKADAEVLFMDETYEADGRAFDIYIRFSSLEEWRELLHHSDADVRWKAIQALSPDGVDHEWLPLLKEDIVTLLQDEDEIVRSSALNVLHRRAPAEALRPLLDDEDGVIREIAIIVLDNRATVEDIEKALKDRNGYEGWRAIFIAAYHPDPAVKEALISHIKNSDAPNRVVAAESLIWAMRNDFIKPDD